MARARLRIRGLVVALVVLAPIGTIHAQNGDPADLAFWQSISNSSNPDEYKAYLQAFPNGRFAPIAKLRADGTTGPVQGPGQPPMPVPVPVPVPVPGGTAPVSPVKEADPDAPSLTVTPPVGRVGQKFVINLANFPEADSREMIVVVPAGTPVMNPTMSADQTKIVWSGYVANAKSYNNTLRDVGPLAPGRYEVRWMSLLYNNQNLYENKATASLTVR